MTPPSVIDVTARHIALGVAGDCHTCPVALAVVDAWKPAEVEHVSVFSDVEIELADGKAYIATLPNVAFNWLRRFDVGKVPLEPFSFSLKWAPL